MDNNKSALKPEVRDFVTKEIQRLVETKAVIEVNYEPWCCSPLTVVVKEGKNNRLVMDVSRNINIKMEPVPVKLLTLEQFNADASKGKWFASTDMKAGYNHISIHPYYRDLFGFSWVGDDGVRRFYIWQCCFYGLMDMVGQFSNCVRPLIEEIRAQGVPAEGYVDDVGWLAETEAEAWRGKRLWQLRGVSGRNRSRHSHLKSHRSESLFGSGRSYELERVDEHPRSGLERGNGVHPG